MNKNRPAFRRLFQSWENFFSEEENPEEISYDPVHLGATILISLWGMAILFWIGWAIFVAEGGIFPKLNALFQIAFQGKSFRDFGYEGYPYELGIFEGWIVNAGGLAAGCAVALLAGRALKKIKWRGGA